ncbi:papain family cysteine protease (macronuclear) [Tetrahymena thermophila SB210]|uniref:Papain family cysteine protease n=1 Tax=Tetrahymena thermophila (strain SB210) TaxID=312017 RepID=I7MJA8_TETTS|nr:papain family cysteine protease [Tetrahymena thermophila SB210]EAR96135.1 papain family cysteine protease [Tetrahymena thermophila SB210]|eukprot:XP_001016380.1 papain family cysteine protease [Tetrahymena thermophila SB210]
MNSKIIFTALLALLLSSSLAQQNNPQIEALNQYIEWIKTNPKVFINDDEKLFRQTVFLENFQKVQDHNSNTSHTYKLGLNQFSDMTQEEFAQKILTNHSIKSSSQKLSVSSSSTSSTSIAASFDWRTKGALTPVKNQGNCGSCWAFSATGVMESFNFIKNHVLTSFSEQQLVDCVTTNNGYVSYGCNGGSYQQALQYASKVGMKTESAYPYIGYQGSCKVSGTSNGYKPVSFSFISSTTLALQTAINASPVSVAIDATNLSMYSSGIYNNCNPSNIQLNHAVLAVGYDTQGNWIVKNSWGTQWGQSGYFLLAPNNTCGILDDPLHITA